MPSAPCEPRSTSSPRSPSSATACTRAGVPTGEAAVTLGADGQGMVAGDLVNTASRIQSTAEPGTVLVAEATKRATEAAITYDDAGSTSSRARPSRSLSGASAESSPHGAGRSAWSG